MKYRNLRRSGLQISILSFGTWITFGYQIDDTTAKKLMYYAYDQGINFFDNAEIYAHGKSERLMGRILKKAKWKRSSYILSSKVFFGDGGTRPNQQGLMRKHIVEACHAALKRMKVDYLDLYYCHRPDAHTPIEETVWTMHNLICQGKILYWGTSEWSNSEIKKAHDIAEKNHLIPPTMEQPQYNMFYRNTIEKMYLPLFKNYGLGTTTWSPLASGLLTEKYHSDTASKKARLNDKKLQWLKETVLGEQDDRLSKVSALCSIAQQHEMTMAQMAIGWCLKNPNISSVILGASKVKQLKENIKTLEVLSRFSNELMQSIDAILGNNPLIKRS